MELNKRSSRVQVLNKYNILVKPKRSQMKIQQMAFMIVAVLFLFILVGLFFLGWQYKSLNQNFEQLQKDKAISSLSVISDMSELNCNSKESFCLDADKLEVMSIKDYSDVWPVASIEVRIIYPKPEKWIKCPNVDCNYYEVYDSGQQNKKQYSSFVSICKKLNEFGYVYEKCELGKLIVGVILNEK